MAEPRLTFAIKAVNDASAVLREVQRDIQSLSGTAGESGERVGFLGNVLGGLRDVAHQAGTVALGAVTGALGAVTAGFGLAIKSATDFQAQMNAVAAVSGATKEEFEGLKRVAIDLGAKTAFSAGEVAQGMERLAANGLTAKEIMNGAAAAALNLAAAGGTDLAQAADTVSTAMAVWGLKTSDLTDVVNRLAAAANVSRFGVSDMAQAIAMGGGAAKAAGVEFQDFAAAIAATANYFSSGSDAGTSFKVFLQRLTPTSKEAERALRELGIITADGANRFFDASGRLKSMAEIVDILHESVSRLSEKDRTALLAEAFGTDAMRTAIGLASMTREEFEQLYDTMGQSDAAVIAEQRLRGLPGAFEQLRGAIESARIELGEKLAPFIERIVRGLAEAIPRMTEAFGRFSTELQTNVWPKVQPVLEQFRAAWERLQPAIEQFLSSKEALIIGLSTLGVVLGAAAIAAASLIAPVVTGAAALAALGAAIGGVIILAGRMGVDWGQVWESVQSAVQRAVEWLQPRVEQFVQSVQAKMRQFGQYWETELRPALERVWSWLQQLFDLLRPLVEASLSIIQELVKSFAEGIRLAMEIFGRLIDVIVQLIQGDWSSAWNSAKEVVKLAWDLIVLAIRTAITVIGQLVGAFIEVGWNLLRAFAGAIGDAFNATVVPFFTGLPGRILGFFATVGTWLVDSGRTLLSGMLSGIEGGWSAISSWLADLPWRFAFALSGAGSWLYDIGRSIMQGLLDGITSMFDTIRNTLGGLKGKIVDWKGPPSADRVLLEPIGRLLMQGLVRGIESQLPAVRAAMAEVTGELEQWRPAALVAPAIRGPEGWMAPAATTSRPGGAPLSAAVEVPVRTEVRVQLDGREVAAAIAEAVARQRLAWGV